MFIRQIFLLKTARTQNGGRQLRHSHKVLPNRMKSFKVKLMLPSLVLIKAHVLDHPSVGTTH